MTVVVDVVDDTGLVLDHQAVKRLVGAVLDVEGLSGEFAVAFVDEASIAELNGRYRASASPTDVLSFDYRTNAGSAGGWPGESRDGGVSGELVVCPQVVLGYAAEEKRDPVSQLGWTLIHGALHLAGYDHETDQGEMREWEQKLLERFAATIQLPSLSAELGS
jgi:probable rRNA maturation factor